MRPSLIRKSRALSVLFLLVSAFIICFELLVVESFFSELKGAVALSRTATLGLSVFVLISGELYHRVRCAREVDNFVEHLKKRKKVDG